MDDTEIKRLSAMTALNNMMRSGHFSICTVDTIGAMLGIDPKGEAYNMLRPLHCVNWSDMPPELRNEVPALIKRCLGVEPIYQFSLPRAEPVRTVEPEPEPKRGFLRLLSRN